MKFKFLPILLCIVLFTSCNDDDSPQITQTLIEVSLKPNEPYKFDTKVSGDEAGASVISPPLHSDISEIIRNQSTNFSAVYRYKPALGYSGMDEVEISIFNHSVAADKSTVTEVVKIIFSISE